jgi:Fe2+ transport system protein FeoA
METRSLTSLRANTDCFVVDVKGEGPFLSRLRELGVEAGAALTVVRPAPSLLLRIGETRIALRSEEASGVDVCIADAHTV